MSYTPTEWQTGDIVTAEKLNKIENGIAGVSSIGGGVFIVGVEKSSPPVGNTGSIYTLNKTWKEIYDAFEGGQIVICRESKDGVTTDSIISSIIIDDFNGSYSVAFSQAVFGQELTTSSENGYPSTFMS